MMMRIRCIPILAAAALSPCVDAGTTLQVETFDGGEFTNPFFNHAFEFDQKCCWGIDLHDGDHALHLRPNSDIVTFNLEPGQSVESISVTMTDFEGGFTGVNPTSVVIVRAAGGDFVPLHVDSIGVTQTLTADVSTPGQLTGKPLGEIVNLQLDAANEGSKFFPQIGAFYDDITIELSGPDIVGDISGDGVVDGLDLGNLLANWSIPAGSPGCGGAPGACPADLNGDGVVDGLDLGILLANWTI